MSRSCWMALCFASGRRASSSVRFPDTRSCGPADGHLFIGSILYTGGRHEPSLLVRTALPRCEALIVGQSSNPPARCSHRRLRRSGPPRRARCTTARRRPDWRGSICFLTSGGDRLLRLTVPAQAPRRGRMDMAAGSQPARLFRSRQSPATSSFRPVDARPGGANWNTSLGAAASWPVRSLHTDTEDAIWSPPRAEHTVDAEPVGPVFGNVPPTQPGQRPMKYVSPSDLPSRATSTCSRRRPPREESCDAAVPDLVRCPRDGHIPEEDMPP